MPLKPPNPYPSLRLGHFGGKVYPLLGVFIQENDVFVYFSDEMGENNLVSTVKLHPMFRDFFSGKTIPHV